MVEHWNGTPILASVSGMRNENRLVHHFYVNLNVNNDIIIPTKMSTITKHIHFGKVILV